MGRSVIGLCAMAGMTVGGFVPAIWGASQFGLSSLLFSVVGAVAGVWFGARLAEY
jgi:outer membrane lipoprotein SlyB